MQHGDWCEVTALASRDLGKSAAVRDELGIPKAYGSYEDLMADPGTSRPLYSFT
jgi:predicted dehydrogenase